MKCEGTCQLYGDTDNPCGRDLAHCQREAIGNAVTKVTRVPVTLDPAADYTGTWVPTSLKGVGTLAPVTGTGGGPLVGATASTGDWILAGLLVCWIVWVIYGNHNGPWRSGKGEQDGMD